MDYKHSCITNANGFYLTIVVQFLVRKPDGSEGWAVQNYTPPEGAQILDTQQPTMRLHAGAEGFVNPRWDGGKWVEGATKKELAAWEKAHPDPSKTAEAVRRERDRRLQAADPTQLLDAPVAGESRDAMRDYRQALRDIPEQEGFPADVVWPELPVPIKAAPDPVDSAFDIMTGGTNNA